MPLKVGIASVREEGAFDVVVGVYQNLEAS